MQLIPKWFTQSINDVSPGSLVYVPGSKYWAIRAAASELFDLKSRRIRDPGGVVLDFGTDYAISVEPDECFHISAVSEIAEPALGSLCLFPVTDIEVHVVLIGFDNFNDTLLVFELETGKKESVPLGRQGVAFKRWEIWLPRLDEQKQNRKIFEYQGNQE